MNRRQLGGDRRSIPILVSVSIDELVSRIEAGSGVAAERLAALVPEAPDAIDTLARSAARGSAASLDLLLSLISAGDLAAPAIGRLTGDRALMDDVRQDVLVAVSNSIGGFRGESRFTTWLYVVARNTTIAHLRRSRPSTPLDQDDRLADGDSRRLSSQVAQRETVRRAIDSLPPAFRGPVQLRDIEGLSYAEIASRLGVEINTVRSRLSRGRAMLAGRLS